MTQTNTAKIGRLNMKKVNNMKDIKDFTGNKDLKAIKDMLLGISILLIIIILHLFFTNRVLTDFLAILAMIIIFGAYADK